MESLSLTLVLTIIPMFQSGLQVYSTCHAKDCPSQGWVNIEAKTIALEPQEDVVNFVVFPGEMYTELFGGCYIPCSHFVSGSLLADRYSTPFLLRPDRQAMYTKNRRYFPRGYEVWPNKEEYQASVADFFKKLQGVKMSVNNFY